MLNFYCKNSIHRLLVFTLSFVKIIVTFVKFLFILSWSRFMYTDTSTMFATLLHWELATMIFFPFHPSTTNKNTPCCSCWKISLNHPWECVWPLKKKRRKNKYAYHKVKKKRKEKNGHTRCFRKRFCKRGTIPFHHCSTKLSTHMHISIRLYEMIFLWVRSFDLAKHVL